MSVLDLEQSLSTQQTYKEFEVMDKFFPENGSIHYTT